MQKSERNHITVCDVCDFVTQYRLDLCARHAAQQTAADRHQRGIAARAGCEGIHFLGVIRQLGIVEQVNSKAKLMEGSVAEFAARDSADIVISQPMEILAAPAYELVGWLPEELQDREKFTWAAGITANAKEPDAARALIRFLTSPEAEAVIKKKGMEPG